MPRTDTLLSPEIAPPAPSRREWRAVGVLILLAFVLRGSFLERTAVEHFDEGVYASNLWFGPKQRSRYPARHLYAPPLVPFFSETSQIILGPTSWGTMLPGVLAGTLTIPVCWWLARSWLGPSAGLVAAALVTTSDYHLLYSRTALTEPILAFFLTGAVFCTWSGISKRCLKWAVAAGLLTGLTWLSKYNGWLPWAIGVSGLAAACVVPPRMSEGRLSRLLLILFLGVIAILLVFPAWRDLQIDGGYQVVQENHRRYLVGFLGWISSLGRQIANHRYLDGPLSWAGIVLAVVLSGFADRKGNPTKKPTRLAKAWLWGLALLIASLAVTWGTSIALGILGGTWLLLACPFWSRNTPEHPPVEQRLAYWFLAAWFAGLLLTTPLYTPYPRLTLPWLISAWIAAAALLASPAFQKALAGEYSWQTAPNAHLTLISVFLVGAAGVLFALSKKTIHFPAYDSRTGIETVAGEIHELVRQKFDGRAVVYVYAEPSLFYHLRAQGLSAVPIAFIPESSDSASVPVLFAFGPHARRSEAFLEEWDRRGTNLEAIANFSLTPSDFNLLNHYSPRELRSPAFSREQSISLYRLRSPE